MNLSSYVNYCGISVKKKYNSIIQNWQMTFQTSDYKRNHFLDLLNDDYLPIKPTYIKDST